MINELHGLAVAMQNASITAQTWHSSYREIPNISAKSPCVRILLKEDGGLSLESVSPDTGRQIRKYGNNQGSFPAMNLAPLYRITEPTQVNALKLLLKNNGNNLDFDAIQSWCSSPNWSKKFLRKYGISFKNIPHELERLLQGNTEGESILRLVQATRSFEEHQTLFDLLQQEALQMLEQRRDIVLALRVLFHCGADGADANDDFGSLSVIFDMESLEDDRIPSISEAFSKITNQALLATEGNSDTSSNASSFLSDAFSLPFSPCDDPMPKIDLAAGFTVSLRTMFDEKPCQYRYGYAGNDTYPLGKEKRMELKTALEWLGGKDKQEHRDKTWVSLVKDEALFVYPSQLSKLPLPMTSLFKHPQQNEDGTVRFEQEAEKFADCLVKIKNTEPEAYPEHIQIFILKKLDKARTTVVYSRNTTPLELLQRSTSWKTAFRNLPPFWFGAPWTLFPVRVADVLNRFWKQDGTLANDKLHPVPYHHGIELLFGLPEVILRHDLQMLVQNSTNLIIYSGSVLHTSSKNEKHKNLPALLDALALASALLAELGSIKEEYMKNYAYLFGQMLQVSDALHELYCYHVRNKQLPPQLAGSALYVSAMDFPTQTFALLGVRMAPYIAWAKTNRSLSLEYSKKDGTVGTGRSAGSLLYAYQQLSDQLAQVFGGTVRFSDEDKAQLFIGFLASLPSFGSSNSSETPSPTFCEQ